MPKRKHINLSAVEIKKAIDQNKDDTALLKELLHEITYRKKAKKSLAPYVKKAQSYINSETSPEVSRQASKTKSSFKTASEKKSSINEVDNKATQASKEPFSEKSSIILQSDKSSSRNSQNAEKRFEDVAKKTESNKSETSKLLGKLGYIREASPDLKGLPQVWSLTPEVTFEVRGLVEANSNSERFKCALSGLIWEIRKGAKFSKTVHLKNGKKQNKISGEYGHIYSFVYTSDEEFFEGASIDVKAGSKRTKGSIVSMLSGAPASIIISLEEDFGESIAACSITQDEAALLEALQNRYEAELGINTKNYSPVGMNTNLSDMLLEGKSERLKSEEYTVADVSALNSGQSSFVKKALSHSISFLWGPPGTGKTQALGTIAAHFFTSKERTLVCSNTNQAVDQVLLKLCREIKKQGRLKDLEDGKIVRVGRIIQKELSDEFSSYVTVDGIAERKSAELTNKIKELEYKASKHGLKIQDFEKLLLAFEKLIDIEKQQLSANKNISDFENKINTSLVRRQACDSKLRDLNEEKDRYGSKGFLGKAFSRGIESIEADITSSQRKLNEAERSVEKLTTQLRDLKLSIEKYPSEIATAKKATHGHDFTKTKDQFESEKGQLSIVNSELAVLKKQIEEMRKTILSQATMIGATLTKSFLSPSELGKFFNIIIDEASMGLLPAIYFTSSQSSKRCIISGDFRQLPPIVQSRNKTILDLIGTDIFAYSGMEEIFQKRSKCSYADVLSEQYRMDPIICDLISEIGYDGYLFTSRDRVASDITHPEILNKAVTIIDTSAIYPFTDRDPFGSTSNLMHSLIARNIMRLYGNSKNSGTIGYCAPFKAQTKLLKKMSAGESYESRASIGTVHTFQGDEKDTIIFDTVNSLGEKQYLNPSMSQESASKSNLITVAISRSQSQLVFIANLRYLDAKIPAMGYLRKVLYRAQNTGNVIDAREIIDLSSFEEEAGTNAFNYQDLGVTLSDLKSGLVNEDSFFPLLKQDLLKANKYIAIYSGFYTAGRVSDLLPMLIGKIGSGVKVRVIIPPPNRNGSMSQSDSEMIAEKLESYGILVEFRSKIHQKAVLIDTDTAWFGSLNPLSFSGKTEETMLRIKQTNITGTFAANMAVNRNSAKEDPSLIVEAELPDCSYCGAKVSFNRGKFGAYVTCISCDKKQSLKGF
jgi:hypothetical protein